MANLTVARIVVATRSFRRWRRSLGFGGPDGRSDLAEAKRLAADVEWAARRLPFRTRCLPRAVALSWMLRRRQITHSVVLAVRPADRRSAEDDLHAWVEVDRTTVLGHLPGPWVEMYRAGR
jgi:hypothetical protein